MPYSIGLDYGTNSVRGLIIDVANGRELATAVYNYQSGQNGILLDPKDHNLARQDPADYLNGLEHVIKEIVSKASSKSGDFDPSDIIGLGVDTTGSTPIPVDKKGTPLSLLNKFKDNLNAYAWLWKDHTSHAEAVEITELAHKEHPEYLGRCGGVYSSEWFFSKILHCKRIDPEIFNEAYSWVEAADYIPAVLTGNTKPEKIVRGRCAAGHKAMFNDQWDGLPAKDFLKKLDPALASLRDRLYDKTYTIDTPAGKLTSKWADKLGIPKGIPVAVGAFDAHLGAVGSGIGKGKLVKIIGTSTCDIITCPNSQQLEDIPGLCGIVDGSVLPGYWGLEAGQSAVGDIFNWFVNNIQADSENGSHEKLTEKASKLKPGQSGLLALDWNNGNRTILVDQRLSGLLIGQTLHTKPEEIYRALIEATAFGALTIINRFEEYGVKIEEIINCGGIAEKNPFFMQIYADVLGREMKVTASSQTCALGSAIAGAVVAGADKGGYDTFDKAQAAICSMKDKTYKPIKENQKVYTELYQLYKQLHDGFGLNKDNAMGNVMKDLLDIKERALKNE